MVQQLIPYIMMGFSSQFVQVKVPFLPIRLRSISYHKSQMSDKKSNNFISPIPSDEYKKSHGHHWASYVTMLQVNC